MSHTRAQASRHVRQRKLNTKQPLRIFREREIDETPDDESRGNIPHVETGVEKGEEIEYHLQAVINAANAAALGAAAAGKQSYIPTPETVKAKGVVYDDLYPKAFATPATYIRSSSTVEDCVGVSYCMNDEDAEFLSKLNDGKDVNDEPRQDKLGQCSEDVFEEAMNYLEETTARLQPFASVESVSLPGLDEMERAIDDNLSADAQTWLKPIYQYWWSKKGSRSLMPSIKVRVLDTSNDADDADPYVCFRRREVRQTRKTRGRDAQVVEKLKKLRLELEQARQLVQLVVQREQLNKEDLEISRRVFEERKKLKDVKIDKNIIGEKGEDEELLVNQKPAPKAKRPQEAGRPATIRLRSAGDRSAPEDELTQLADIQAQADAEVQRTIAARKEQHRRWNAQWEDETWRPLTPPLDDNDEKPRWAPLALPDASYPTPPPTVPSENSPDRDDVEMQDAAPIREEDTSAGALPEPEFVFHIPGAYPQDEDMYVEPKRDPTPLCRLRYGRGGRCWLEARRKRPYALISRGVVSDSESDDEEPPDFFPIDQQKVFDLRVGFMTGRIARPESMGGERRGWSSGEQAAVAGASGQQQQPSQAQQQQTPAGSAG